MPGVASSAPDLGALSAEQRSFLAPAWRREVEGWIHLHVEGSPRARGFAHGWLLAPELAEALRVIRALLVFDTGVGLDLFARAAELSANVNVRGAGGEGPCHARSPRDGRKGLHERIIFGE